MARTPGSRRGGRHTPAANGGKWLRPTTRRALLLRDGYRCAYCPTHRHCHEGGLTVDHYVPPELGGTNHPSNLLVACPSCNSRKGDRSPRAWWAYLRAQGMPEGELHRRQRRARRLRATDLTPYRVAARRQLADEALEDPCPT